jgi:hypothetical protein
MILNPLIFSNNRRYRLTRHSLFWVLWLLYYTVFTCLYWQNKIPFFHALPCSLVEIGFTVPLDMAFCYSIIYFLLPHYLYRGRYIEMTLLWILFSILYILAYRTYYYYAVPSIREAFGMPPPVFVHSLPWVFLDLFYQVNMEGCLAAAIKLGKMWFIKQQELDLLKKEKQKIEPHLQEGKLQPVFLINALDKVEQLSVIKPALVPGMVKHIKSLLLYVIYDNYQASVSLEKELKLLEEYVELERTGIDGNLQVTVKMNGNTNEEKIAPFIILPIVQNGFRQLSYLDLPQKFIDLDIRVEEGSFQMNVGWSKPTDSSTLINGSSLSFQHIGKRLNLLYPQSHEMKVIITTDQFLINLKMDLRRAIN